MKTQAGFAYLLLLLFILLVLGGAYFFFTNKNTKSPNGFSVPSVPFSEKKIVSGKNNPFAERYSEGKCQGEGTVTFTYSPMNIENIGEILPYGIMVDAHVIPTSHGYISPLNFQSERDLYPVFAPADGFIVNVSHRGQFVGDNNKDKVTDEYQMYFEHSCTFYSYYDLLTSLSPEIEKEVGKLTGFENRQVRIPVKAGQLVGRIGGQTVDFAVWNFAKEPAYFANPANYDEDRPYLEHMFAYFKEPLKSQLLEKNRRVREPRSGKVAYDIEGKLVGNWFREGSGGFAGIQDDPKESGYRYWDGHLSVSYDFINPEKVVFSIGNFNGKAAQFDIQGNSPDPATVGMESGAIKYELINHGSQNTPGGSVAGTVLLQLIEKAKLKLELFPNMTADQVSGFTSNSQMYER